MRIACIYPSSISPIAPHFNTIAGEPLGLLYIAGVANSFGAEIKIFIPDVLEDNESFTERILAFSPNVLTFYVMTFQVYRSIELLHEIKQKKPNVVAIAGGPHPTIEPEFLLYRGFDVCVSGEGEIAFHDILIKLSKNEDIKGVAGTTYIDNGRIVNIPQYRRANLDELPLPIRIPSLLDGKSYNGIAYPAPYIKGWASISTTRGCPYSCTFCNAPQMWYKRITRRSVEKVIEEITHLHKTYQVELFEFVDLVFALNPQYTMTLCEKIMHSKLNIHWFCMSNVNSLDNLEMPFAMKEAGCSLISLGIESLNNKTLRRINKKSCNSKAEELISLLDSIGIPVNIFYIVGFPWQSEQDIFTDAEFLYQLRAHKIQVFIATPFPKTDFWFQVKKDLIPNSYHLYDTNNLVFKHPWLSPKEAQEIQKTISCNFYLHKNYKERIITFLKKFPKYTRSFLSYFKTLPFYEKMKEVFATEITKMEENHGKQFINI